MNSLKDPLEQLAEEVMFHRYCYYVLANPQISDRDYDFLEHELTAKDTSGKYAYIWDSVGSDRKQDYPRHKIYDEIIESNKTLYE